LGCDRRRPGRCRFPSSRRRGRRRWWRRRREDAVDCRFVDPGETCAPGLDRGGGGAWVRAWIRWSVWLVEQVVGGKCGVSQRERTYRARLRLGGDRQLSELGSELAPGLRSARAQPPQLLSVEQHVADPATGIQPTPHPVAEPPRGAHEAPEMLVARPRKRWAPVARRRVR